VSWSASQIAAYCGGELSGPEGRAIEGVSTDSRSIRAGELFVAIAGESFDGHEYIEAAVERGAGAVLTARPDGGASVPVIRVADTIEALGRFARGHRESFRGPVIAITGSNGKTTTKELCADMLEAGGARVRRTLGNLNNHIGLPLSVLRSEPGDDVLVVEMGMNHSGEIDLLASIAQPDVGAITQVAPAHLGSMGSIEAIALAKGELLDHIRPGGTAVLNADDARVMAQRKRFAGRAIRFGFGEDAEFRAREIETTRAGTRFRLETPLGSCSVELAVPGQHVVQDALCAAAAASASGALGTDPLQAIRRSLGAFRGVSGRTQLIPAPGDVLLLDDSYNANPHSVEAALHALIQLKGAESDRRAIAVLGDMLELGAGASELHSATGRLAARSGVDALLGVGELSAHTVESARGAGIAITAHAPDAAASIDIVQGWLRPGDCVLVIGSKAMKMGEIVRALEEKT
jgi:UDP-N-acetylmuramoyl-tripeptide--D-alanyl-D-alanine ligase